MLSIDAPNSGIQINQNSGLKRRVKNKNDSNKTVLLGNNYGF